MKHLLIKLAAIAVAFAVLPVNAANYVIDTKGAHASIEFKIQHLGYSWLKGRFNSFNGSFEYDSAKPNDSRINVDIDTTSLDSNHADRDKHLKGKDFLDVGQFPEAKFVSTGFNFEGADKAVLTGELTLHGVTRPISIDINKVGEGKDPWGGYRVGFTGTTAFKLKDFGISYNLGPASETVFLELNVEGIRQ